MDDQDITFDESLSDDVNQQDVSSVVPGASEDSYYSDLSVSFQGSTCVVSVHGASGFVDVSFYSDDFDSLSFLDGQYARFDGYEYSGDFYACQMLGFVNSGYEVPAAFSLLVQSRDVSIVESFLASYEAPVSSEVDLTGVESSLVGLSVAAFVLIGAVFLAIGCFLGHIFLRRWY